MEDSPSSFTVSSPRRTLSLQKREKRGAPWPSPERENSIAEERGAKPSEVYGFVGAISAVIASAVFLVWAYTPEPWLHALGITYYPSKYWALAVPAYAIMAIVLSLAFYLGLNFISTPPPTSFATLFDEHSREPSDLVDQEDKAVKVIHPLSDMSITNVNDLMFGRIS